MDHRNWKIGLLILSISTIALTACTEPTPSQRTLVERFSMFADDMVNGVLREWSQLSKEQQQLVKDHAKNVTCALATQAVNRGNTEDTMRSFYLQMLADRNEIFSPRAAVLQQLFLRQMAVNDMVKALQKADDSQQAALRLAVNGACIFSLPRP